MTQNTNKVVLTNLEENVISGLAKLAPDVSLAVGGKIVSSKDLQAQLQAHVDTMNSVNSAQAKFFELAGLDKSQRIGIEAYPRYGPELRRWTLRREQRGVRLLRLQAEEGGSADALVESGGSGEAARDSPRPSHDGQVTAIGDPRRRADDAASERSRRVFASDGSPVISTPVAPPPIITTPVSPAPIANPMPPATPPLRGRERRTDGQRRHERGVALRSVRGRGSLEAGSPRRWGWGR